MTQMTPAELIAANLAALPHPDGTPRQLAGYSTSLLPDTLAEQVSSAARDIGAAIVHLLESSGWMITRGVAAAAADSPPATTSLHCLLCGTKLLELGAAGGQAQTAGPQFIDAMQRLSPGCPHQ